MSPLPFAAFLLLAPARGAENPEKELRVMVFDPTWEAWGDLQELGREFERENPGVRVRFLSDVGGADQLAKLKIMLAARQPLDVTWLDVVELSAFLDDGAVLDLQPFIERDPDWRPEEFFDGPLEALRGRDGHLYGLPSTFTPYVMYFNKDLLDREGISYPKPGWTWDDLLEIARRCTKRPGQYGISITQWLQALAPWIWQNGGEFLDENLGRCILDSPEAVGALRFLTDLFFVERVASTDATYEAQLTRSLFQDGRVALYGPVGYWEVYRFKNITRFRWDVCPLPRGKREATSIAMRGYVGIRRTEHPELTYRFLRKLAGEKMSRALARIGNGVPGLRRAATSEDFLKPGVPPEGEQVFLDVLPHARFLPGLANWREIEAAAQEELQGCLLLGKLDAETACRRIAAKANALLERERRERERPRVSWTWLALLVGGPLAALIGLLFRKRGLAPAGSRRREEGAAKGFLALWAAGFLLFTLGPMLASLALSFTVWTPIRPLAELRWAGADNYLRMASDGGFWKSLEVTAVYTLLSLPLSLLLALGLALLVHKGHALFRTVLYMPVIASAVAVGILWRWILGPSWLESESWILPGFALMSLWNVGGPMLVFLAGLQGIDPSLYEAARLDGASPWRQLLHVTVPQLTPVLLFNLVMGTLQSFQTFAQPYVMTQGGPGNASLFYVLNLYNHAFKFQQMGYASALGWVLFLLLLGLTILLLRTSKGWVHYEGEAA